MVISNLLGGLGNQMFQYAAGRALSIRLGEPLKLDTRDFTGYKLHQGFELSRLFNCDAEIVTNENLKKVLRWHSSKLVQRIFKRQQLTSLRCNSYVVEPTFNYWPGVRDLSGDVYLDGYWQSEQYFEQYTGKIRKDFTFKLPLSLKNKEIAEKILQVNAVGLHVRRGDYVTNSKNAYIGVCSLDYYKIAIEEIKGLVDKPIFFVFSDDISWVKSNLVLNNKAVFICHNQGNESYNDMRLMSLCKHNIIANSSFSWWGAWLNANPNKIVIAPKKWFASKLDDSDLVPHAWLRF